MVDRLSLALAPPLPDAQGHHISYFFWFFAQVKLGLTHKKTADSLRCGGEGCRDDPALAGRPHAKKLCRDDSVALPLEAATASPQGGE